MSDGKKATAPCGHPGEHVIGTFVVCSQGCDDERVTPACGVPTQTRRCPACGSAEVELFSLLGSGGVAFHCWPCGTVF